MLCHSQVNSADSGSSSEGDSDEDGGSADDDAEDMDTDGARADSGQQQHPQRAPPVVDDDGFQLVQRKGRR